MSTLNKRITSLILPPLLLMSFTTTALAELWGSTQSNSYHIASCRYVKKTLKANRVKFDSAADAAKAGYKPCEVCKPPKATLPGAPKQKGTPAG